MNLSVTRRLLLPLGNKEIWESERLGDGISAKVIKNQAKGMLEGVPAVNKRHQTRQSSVGTCRVVGLVEIVG